MKRRAVSRPLPRQHACKLIIAREPVEAITRQLSLALFMDAKLDLGAKSAPRGAVRMRA